MSCHPSATASYSQLPSSDAQPVAEFECAARLSEKQGTRCATAQINMRSRPKHYSLEARLSCDQNPVPENQGLEVTARNPKLDTALGGNKALANIALIVELTSLLG